VFCLISVRFTSVSVRSGICADHWSAHNWVTLRHDRLVILTGGYSSWQYNTTDVRYSLIEPCTVHFDRSSRDQRTSAVDAINCMVVGGGDAVCGRLPLVVWLDDDESTESIATGDHRYTEYQDGVFSTKLSVVRFHIRNDIFIYRHFVRNYLTLIDLARLIVTNRLFYLCDVIDLQYHHCV